MSDQAIDPTIDQDGPEPVYPVTATAQEDGQWLLTADLPGGPLEHAVRTLDDPAWVTRELTTVIAAHLGVAEDSFGIRIDRAAGRKPDQ